ncbi:MAG: DbpA RNA binding domain-containing protein, partial [Myxococcales bacterium]|nr:DbpA RNA binding domain-containing protein [Myxococcales bacterium]
HRVGRTARAGHEGLANTLVAPGDRTTRAPLRQGPLGGTAHVPLPPASSARPAPPAMITMAIQGGRQDRLRPGDIVGALTTGVGITAAEIGKIELRDQISFVALAASVGPRAIAGINQGRIKTKRFRAYQVTPPRRSGPDPR